MAFSTSMWLSVCFMLIAFSATTLGQPAVIPVSEAPVSEASSSSITGDTATTSLPLSTTGSEVKCHKHGGQCLDRTTQQCTYPDGVWALDLCPGSANITCCLPLNVQ